MIWFISEVINVLRPHGRGREEIPVRFDLIIAKAIHPSFQAREHQETVEIMDLEGLGQGIEIEPLADSNLEVDLERVKSESDRRAETP
jgi:hypothetical protein